MKEIFEELQADYSYFESGSSGITLHRQNPDKGVNNYGYRLAEFCRNNGLFILNGRTKGNSTFNTTCKNVSTIDYFLSSVYMFKYVNSIHVHDFCELLSDAHNAVSLKLEISYSKEMSQSQFIGTEHIKLWDTENIEIFENCFDENELKSSLDRLNFLSKNQNVTQSDVNEIVDSLNNVFQSNAKKSFGTFIKKRLKSN